MCTIGELSDYSFEFPLFVDAMCHVKLEINQFFRRQLQQMVILHSDRETVRPTN